jgi:hypothetical protein
MTVTTVATSTELTIGYIVDGMVAASRVEIGHPDTERLGRACRFLFEIAVNRGASLLDVAAPSGDAATTPTPGCPLRGRVYRLHGRPGPGAGDLHIWK